MTSRVHKASRALACLLAGSALAGSCLALLAGARGPLAVVGAVSVAASPGEAVAITTPVELSRAPSLVLESGRLSLAAARPETAGAGEAALGMLASGKAELLIENAVLVLRLSEGAPSPAQITQDLAPFLAALVDKRFEIARLSGATVVLAKADGSAERLVDAEADVAVRHGGLDARGAFTLRGEKFAFSASLGALDAESGERRLNLKIDGAPVAATLTGRLGTTGGPRVMADAAEIRAPSLEGAARWLGATWAAGSGLRDLTARGALTWSDHVMVMDDATIALDGNEGRGNLTLALKGDRPSVEGTLAFDRFNIAPYIAAMGGQPFAIPLLASLDADLRLSAEQVAVGDVELGGGAASLSLDDGRLMADIAELTALGGGGEGQLTFDVAGAEPKYNLRGKLEGMDGALVTRTLFGAAVFEGPVNATFDLKARGPSGEGLLSTLAGKIAVELIEDGRIGVDVERLASMPVGAVENGWGEATARATEVDWLLGRFTLDQGVATAQSVTAGAGARRISAVGGVNLLARDFDLRLSIGPRLGTDASRSPTRDVAIEITGPWAAPTLRAVDQPKAARPAEPAPPRGESPDRG